MDTFEEEEPVDIGAVVKDLKALEMDMQETDKTIAGFCKETGNRKSVFDLQMTYAMTTTSTKRTCPAI